MVGHLSSVIVTDSFITIYFVTVSHAVINVIFITFFPSLGEDLSLCFSDPVAPVNKYPDMYISDYVIFFLSVLYDK